MIREFNDQSPYINQSLFNPEWIYGVCCPVRLFLINLTITTRWCHQLRLSSISNLFGIFTAHKLTESSMVIWISILVAGMGVLECPVLIPRNVQCICWQASMIGVTLLPCPKQPAIRFVGLNTKLCQALGTSLLQRIPWNSFHICWKPLNGYDIRDSQIFRGMLTEGSVKDSTRILTASIYLFWHEAKHVIDWKVLSCRPISVFSSFDLVDGVSYHVKQLLSQYNVLKNLTAAWPAHFWFLYLIPRSSSRGDWESTRWVQLIIALCSLAPELVLSFHVLSRNLPG